MHVIYEFVYTVPYRDTRTVAVGVLLSDAALTMIHIFLSYVRVLRIIFYVHQAAQRASQLSYRVPACLALAWGTYSLALVGWRAADVRRRLVTRPHHRRRTAWLYEYNMQQSLKVKSDILGVTPRYGNKRQNPHEKETPMYREERLD